MRSRDFKKILKEKTIKEILSMHLQNEIYLTYWQLDKILKNNDGRGGCVFRYKRSNPRNI